jgi:hypothetical protein
MGAKAGRVLGVANGLWLDTRVLGVADEVPGGVSDLRREKRESAHFDALTRGSVGRRSRIDE